jgi:type 1 glutamine amidotransferase
VLIVTGIDHPAHLWRETAPVLRKVLSVDKRLSVDVVEDPEYLASEKLDQYDTIVLHFMNWEKPDPSRKAQQNLHKFVESGKGLVLVHFACGAFQDWPQFRELAGRVWDPKKRPHDPHGKFHVEITDINHPVTKQMQSFETTDELYTCLVGDRQIDVLATARSKVDNKDYPMAFAFNCGKGRVFHSPLGHDVKAISNPPVAELFRRGCAWAAGLEPVKQKKIVFIAGKDSHLQGEHEHEEGIKLFKKCLDNSRNVTGIDSIVVFERQLYEDVSILDDSDAIVIYSDGWENHPLANKAVFEKTRKLMSQGVGMVCIHFAIAPPKDKEVESFFLDRLGGMYQDGYSKNPVESIVANIASAEHPVSAGCGKFSAGDEFYYCLRFTAGGAAAVTPLLTITKPDENPNQQTVAWATERTDGGRSFGISGGHFHKNWQIKSLRKMVLNAILWTAKVPVPEKGVSSTVK